MMRGRDHAAPFRAHGTGMAVGDEGASQRLVGTMRTAHHASRVLLLAQKRLPTGGALHTGDDSGAHGECLDLPETKSRPDCAEEKALARVESGM
jgi:hypothetical protein